jgi:ribonuclease Z
MDLDVVFIGTAGAAPSARRGLPSTLVRRGGDRLLFDCGEGTQRQLLKSVGLVDLEHLFLTHYHADHVLGIPGMLKSFALRDREAPITIYGPPGLNALFRIFDPLLGRLPYELTLQELEPNEELRFDGYRVAAFDVDHRVRAYGYAVLEDWRPGRFDEVKARELGVTPGPDFGRLQRGETVGDVTPDQVLGEPRRGRKVVLSGDTRPCEMTELVAREADVLVHEATFTDDEVARARETGHSTARGVAKLASDAQVAMLALTHVSPRYAGPELRDEARETFADTVVPRDFDQIEVPFPERGTPIFHKVQDLARTTSENIR